MKKPCILLFFLIFILVSGFSQSEEILTELNTERLKINKSAMIVLGSWATVNILSGLALRNNSQGSTRYFHEMNFIWNTVNLAIAGFGLYSSINTDPSSFDFWQTYNEQQKLEKILLFNGALNVSYMLAGAFLKERAKTASKKPERLKGYGNSLLLQGGFLLLFDTAQYWIHHSSANPQLKQLFQQLSVSPNGIGMSFYF